MIDYKNSIFYQIWPRSFKDSNNDGIGDIQGIIQKLDYLKNLGIDAIWLSPIYKTNNDDYGYDVVDYYSINEEYGSMEDFDELILEAKKRNIEIIMDLVANHTSTSHQWFLEAIKDKNSKYRDYYFFEKKENINNWLSFFGNSSWVKQDDYYYLASFSATQADLNWANIEVRNSIYNVMKFYLNKGICGFRMDVINTIDKKEGLPDKNPHLKGLQFPDDYIIDGKNVDKYLKEMNEKVLTPYDALGLGEAVLVKPEIAINYTKKENKELHMTFQFDLAMLGYGELGKYDFRKGYRFSIKDFKNITSLWQESMYENGGYLGNYLSNHDHKRHIERYGDIKKYHKESSKALALYNFTLYGSPFIYQGEEIGMTNPKLKYKDWKDPECFNSYEAMTRMLHVPKFIAKKISSYVTRDNARTPIHWSKENYAGFSNVEPWMYLNPNYKKINIEDNLNDKDSILNFYKKCISLRKNYPSLIYGSFLEIQKEHPHIIAYIREYNNERMLIMINLDKKKRSIILKDKYKFKHILSNYKPKNLVKEMLLEPFEAHIYLIN
ncbi:MAG: alpha-glucosidase [Erysipelotrichaceae bacterium]|nr:alpha-glucosidase [Erysipelotrichaceae bacterium]